MTKCLSCGHIYQNLELNCPECGSFYSKITDEILPDAGIKETNSAIKESHSVASSETNTTKQPSASLAQRFLQLFR